MVVRHDGARGYIWICVLQPLCKSLGRPTPWAFLAALLPVIATAAGPLFSLFLLEQKLDKETYVSTRAWAFFIINLAKLPFYMALGLFSLESVQVSLYGLPGLAIGSFLLVTTS